MNTNLLIITALESELKREALPTGIEIVYSGIGKINATLTTVKAIHQFAPKQILNFGTAGKVNPSLHGLLSIAKVIQRDMHTEPLAPRGMTPFCERPHEYRSSGKYLCGSGDSFVTAHDPWLHSQGVDIVDMELFAIAASAHHHDIPWTAYKYITDDANENSGNDWQEKVNHGQDLFLQELKQVLS
ncbi:5'-methylthioadenosine nucleosidase [Polynucleobacter sp. AP-Kolm-20A-A1]|uniref:phosphorylase family protein n=1 Tax=Polynucleobacter sp. AP-Kolm-20A-A1 TaxID=2081041 RepID=UPI001BFD3BE0|nr:5'-methylthioadenosine nucleosidase [Polynucleobacter sp. AP-Kolm-20A-A1]QWE21440.1 5'-methylthioadenosine nucleosidase [Polynucleobacter sp. AP-Kolm-20A-A1]